MMFFDGELISFLEKDVQHQSQELKKTNPIGPSCKHKKKGPQTAARVGEEDWHLTDRRQTSNYLLFMYS